MENCCKCDILCMANSFGMTLIGEDHGRLGGRAHLPPDRRQPSSNNTSNEVEKECTQWGNRLAGEATRSPRAQANSTAIALRAKVGEDLQLQHPVQHLSVCKLCSKPGGKREKRRKDRAGAVCMLLCRVAEQSLPSRKRPRQSARELRKPGGGERRGVGQLASKMISSVIVEIKHTSQAF